MSESILNSIQQGNLTTTTTYHAGTIQATLHRKLQKFCDDVLIPYGISKMQWMIVGTVFDYKATGIRISDLAKIVGTNLPYMTNTVNLLEQKHILKRIENHVDSRSTLVTVAPGYLPKCRKIEETLREALRTHIYADISPEDFRIYMKVMTMLAQKK